MVKKNPTYDNFSGEVDKDVHRLAEDVKHLEVKIALGGAVPSLTEQNKESCPEIMKQFDVTNLTKAQVVTQV